MRKQSRHRHELLGNKVSEGVAHNARRNVIGLLADAERMLEERPMRFEVFSVTASVHWP